jgi:hypothetical protein
MYALIQYPSINSNLMQIVKLNSNSKISAAGYVIGSYKIVFPKLSIKAARKIMQVLNSEGA